jgi:Trypsin
MKKRLMLAAAALAALLVSVVPAGAVTDGALDGEGHPYVGLMVAQDAKGAPLWRCSGTLLSAKVFLTAGHCTEAPAAHVEIWFQSDVQSGIPGNGYPLKGQVGGTPYTHPDYDPNAFFVRDLGVVVLDTPMAMSTYGKLPALNQLDALKPGAKTRFTSVGYGLQKAFPDAAAWKDQALRVRMVATPQLLQINTGFTGDFSLLLSNNANTGGTCFGDSGGPTLVAGTNQIVAVTSFGISPNCTGTDDEYRIDQADDLAFLASFGVTP